MGLAKNRVFRHSRAVSALQQWPQHLIRLYNRSGQLRLRKLKIGDIGEFLQTLHDLHRPQALFRQLFYQLIEGQIVHSCLEHFLIPTAKAAVFHGSLCCWRFRHRFFPEADRTGALIADAVTGIAFGIDLIDFPCLGRPGQGNIFVLFIDRTGFLAIDPDQHFFSATQVKNYPLPFQLRRDHDLGPEPGILPLLAPASAHGRSGVDLPHRVT